MTAVANLISLAKAAEAHIGTSFNAPDVLPYAADALTLIAANPDLRAEFESEFLAMHSYAPSEFVEVCMHALRWPDVRKEFEKRQREAIEKNDWRSEPVYRHYLEAFEDDWEDAKDFYAGFFK